MSDFCVGPAKPIAPVPAGYKGGAGDYDGKNGHGLPARTPSPNGVPEKFIDVLPDAKPGTKAGG